MIYNFNLGIGWASSGVEYAQSYRAKMLRNIGAEAKFIFTDMIPTENIEHLTANIGFEDSEIIWLYTFFTDQKIEPVTYTLSDLEQTFGGKGFEKSREGKITKYVFEGKGNFYTAYMVDEHSDRVHRVELVSKGYLIRKDYFLDRRIYSEYYAPLDNSAHMYNRRFFNRDGSLAYEEINDDDNVIYKFKDKIIYNKEELVGYMTSMLNLTEDDIVIIDRTTGVGQAILMASKPAKVGIVIHADHYSEKEKGDNILWNNYYEYSFAQHKHIDFYISATEVQSKLVSEQFEKVYGITPNTVTIPVGSLSELKLPGRNGRRPHSLITASRLASEKHVDWLVSVVAEVKKSIPDVTLDIYGKGPEDEKIKKLIAEHGLEDCVKLMGQQNLAEVYQNYEVYLSGSQSEGFGLTLMEAIGAGLPIVGFDVKYGNQTFIEDGVTGYKVPIDDMMDQKEKISELANRVIRIFTEDSLDELHHNAYEKAKEYLTGEVEKRWQKLIAQIK